jgi:hypothetical protein
MQSDQNNNIVENKEVIQQQIEETKPVLEQETPEQINWKKFREAREVERKQRDAAEKLAAQKASEAEALKQAMDALLNKQSSQLSQSEDEDQTEDEKIQQKVEAALFEREKKFEEQRRQREQAEFPQKLSSAYSDFNQVCSVDNLDYLEYHYPEVASAFKYMPDGFDKWASIYKAVKRFVPNTDSKREQAKAEKNFNKPQSMASAGVAQTGDSAPIMLDDKKRADNWSRMQKVMKGGR